MNSRLLLCPVKQRQAAAQNSERSTRRTSTGFWGNPKM